MIIKIPRSRWPRTASYSAIIIARGQFFKMAAKFVDVLESEIDFVDVLEEEINFMKQNAIPRNTKHATKFGMTLFKGKM